jgi:hypothetical protein
MNNTLKRLVKYIDIYMKPDRRNWDKTEIRNISHLKIFFSVMCLYEITYYSLINLNLEEAKK